MLMWANPPFRGPTRAAARFINRRVAPISSMRCPVRMKKGIAIRGNESSPRNIRCTTKIKGILSVVRIQMTEVTPKEKTTGRFTSNITRNEPNNRPMSDLIPLLREPKERALPVSALLGFDLFDQFHPAESGSKLLIDGLHGLFEAGPLGFGHDIDLSPVRYGFLL